VTRVLAAVAVGLGACASDHPPEDPVRAALDALRHEHLAALADGDLERYLRVFVDDAVFLVPDAATVRGRPAIAEVVRPFFADFRTDERETPREVLALAGGDRAFEWGDLSVSMTPKAGGETVAAAGSYLFFARREGGGRWLYTHMIWNGSTPSPPVPRDVPAAPPEPAFASGAQHDVREALHVLDRACDRGSVDGILACFTDDAVLMPPGEPRLSTPAAIRDYFTRTADAEPARFRGVEEIIADGDVALVCSRRWHVGAPQKILIVLRRGIDGVWRVARALWCGDAGA
jgi:uncharacterized protein (TIGR02246 family)